MLSVIIIPPWWYNVNTFYRKFHTIQNIWLSKVFKLETTRSAKTKRQVLCLSFLFCKEGFELYRDGYLGAEGTCPTAPCG